MELLKLIIALGCFGASKCILICCCLRTLNLAITNVSACRVFVTFTQLFILNPTMSHKYLITSDIIHSEINIPQTNA